MIDLEDITRRLRANAQVISTLLEPVSEEQAAWQPGPETWSLNRVMEHLYNEERLDFRRHLGEMLAHPPQPWSEIDREELIAVPDCREALARFQQERRASLDWLRALDSPDWDVASHASFGEAEELTLHAADVLYSWVAHDFLHIRQLNELLYAWNEHRAAPYSVQYAGGW
jgi:hypothetical protein